MDHPAAARPLSPHLQVYRLTFTMVLSGLHRIMGLALSVCSLLLAGWLVAVARGPEAYAVAGRLLASLPARLVLAGALVAFWYHLFAGFRHLAWDAGLGFEKAMTRKSGGLVVALAALASILTLVAAWRFLGGSS